MALIFYKEPASHLQSDEPKQTLTLARKWGCEPLMSVRAPGQSGPTEPRDRAKSPFPKMLDPRNLIFFFFCKWHGSYFFLLECCQIKDLEMSHTHTPRGPHLPGPKDQDTRPNRHPCWDLAQTPVESPHRDFSSRVLAQVMSLSFASHF